MALPSPSPNDPIVHDIGISADSRCLDDALVPHVPQVLLLYPESEPNEESPLGGLGEALGALQQLTPGSSPPGQAPPPLIGIGPEGLAPTVPTCGYNLSNASNNTPSWNSEGSGGCIWRGILC